MSSEELGLRERKKLQTRDEILRVALELFDSKGFSEATIPEIAERANVSPRTVSSYFPAKEDLVFSEYPAMFDRLEATLESRSHGETVADALRTWVTAEASVWEENDSSTLRMRRIVRSSEHLLAYSKQVESRGEEMIARAIGQDISADPNGLEARMASAATLAIFSVLNAHRDEEIDAGVAQTVSVPDAVALLDRALLFVSAGIRAIREARIEDQA
jgi:AcrR family transcriptional regulator